MPVVTLDETARTHALQGPFLVKLDVQGYELDVLAGSEEVLSQTCALICEVSLWSDRKGQGMAQLLPIVAWLAERGFTLYDIATIVRRDFDDAITEMDLVFLPAASPLRADHRYKRPDQAEAAIAKRRRSFGLE